MGVFGNEEFDFSSFRGKEPFTLNLGRFTDVYWRAGTALAKNIGEVRELSLRELQAGRTIVGEFGQAYWLDKRHGFSGTSSHTYTPEFFESANIPVQRIHTFGVAKAYDTKVGTHTFVTEMDDAHPLCAKLKLLEFGAATGRQRMVGWYDAVEKGRRTLRYGGFEDPDDQQARRPDPTPGSGKATCCCALATRMPTASAWRTFRATRRCARRCARSTHAISGWSEDVAKDPALRRPAAERPALRGRDGEKPPRRRLRRREAAGDPPQSTLPRRRPAAFPDHQGCAGGGRVDPAGGIDRVSSARWTRCPASGASLVGGAEILTDKREHRWT